VTEDGKKVGLVRGIFISVFCLGVVSIVAKSKDSSGEISVGVSVALTVTAVLTAMFSTAFLMLHCRSSKPLLQPYLGSDSNPLLIGAIAQSTVRTMVEEGPPAYSASA